MRQSLGIVKNRTHILFEFKEKIHQQHKQKNNIFKPNQQLLQNIKNVSGESTASNFSIEMQNSQKGIEFEWSVYYEETLDKINQIKDILKELSLLGTKRLKMQFGDATQIERLIYENNQKATSKIIECEQNLDAIKKYSNIQESESDQRIRQNINRALAQQIQDLANQLRNQQKRMVTILKQISSDNGGDFLKLSQTKQQEMKVVDSDLTQAEEQLYDDVIQDRDEEINKLVSMINELAEVFKSLNQLVLDQGTILDRIDYNIDQTLNNVKKANVELVKAEQIQNSPLAQRCIITLVGLIAVCCILLTIKYSSS